MVLLPEELGGPVFSALRSLHLSTGFVGVWPSSRARPGSDAVNGEPTQLPTQHQQPQRVLDAP